MELSRRDALAALAAAGAGSIAGCGAPRAADAATGQSAGGPTERAVGETELATLVAVAEVVYPSVVDGVEGFVRTYTGGRVDGAGAYAAGVADAVAALDAYARDVSGGRFVDLDRETRRETLDVMSVDVVEPDPDGTDAQRVRHYVVNELLYAFYTSPTGAGLAGLENPPGHPGGTVSYREGPGA
ncbi:gluconate 2-dehydrogenase subunit 3 family protein [Halobaculum lipolyticum]|uniref:Gluconate 2-dehydrogenase subunit 3 family protein n=1 Tax=Halobaculum lipolyticum TaxID=3032001 RepID=A0ABD5W680_9EURY|nr:gluconate 2-dehydrogenase subunit 3 family protein [Halobaculum sp. DT31]